VSSESGRCASSKEQTKEKWRTTQLEVRFGGGKGSTRGALLLSMARELQQRLVCVPSCSRGRRNDVLMDAPSVLVAGIEMP
jgi:hypothetical protein